MQLIIIATPTGGCSTSRLHPPVSPARDESTLGLRARCASSWPPCLRAAARPSGRSLTSSDMESGQTTRPTHTLLLTVPTAALHTTRRQATAPSSEVTPLLVAQATLGPNTLPSAPPKSRHRSPFPWGRRHTSFRACESGRTESQSRCGRTKRSSRSQKSWACTLATT